LETKTAEEGTASRKRETCARARDVTGLPFNIAYPSKLTANQAFANFLYEMPLTKPQTRMRHAVDVGCYRVRIAFIYIFIVMCPSLIILKIEAFRESMKYLFFFN